MKSPKHSRAPTWKRFNASSPKIGINPLGWEVTKPDMLAQIGSSDYRAESIVNEVQRVRLFGDVAVVLARGTAKGTFRGERADMVFAYTRIWIHRDGRWWQAVAAHASRLAN